MKKYFIIPAIKITFLACLAVVPPAAQAAQAELRGEQAEQLMRALENTPWIPDGSAADKQIYVFYSTNCGISKKFFEQSRHLTSKAQFRWITDCCVGKGGEYAIEQHTPEAIAEAFNNRSGQVKNLEKTKRAMALSNWSSRKVPGLTGYPTIIYRTANGVAVNHGPPSDLDRMVASVASRPELASHTPQGQALLDREIVLTPVKSMKQYANTKHKEGVPVYVHPDESSLKADVLPINRAYPLMGIANKEWFAVVGMTMNGLPVPGYIHAPQETRLAQLEFKVRPVSGKLQIRKPTEIRLHPDREAPVDGTLQPGYVMTITGEVALEGVTWTEVKYLTDGTKGYLPKSNEK